MDDVGGSMSGKTGKSSRTGRPRKAERKSPLQAAAETGLSSVSCQVPGCTADLSGPDCKFYNQRYKICEVHHTAVEIDTDGYLSRFCQQCAKLHPVDKFDGIKRSCREKLQQHNMRRILMKKVRLESEYARQDCYTCQVPGCMHDLYKQKAYNIHYQVCKEHMSSLEVEFHGRKQRFCQSCAVFQPLADFDGSKRACTVAKPRGRAGKRSKTSDQSPSSGDISPAPSAYDCSLRPPDDDRTQSSPAGRHRSLHWYSTRFPVQPRDTSDVRQHPSACMMAGDDKHGMPGNLHDRATESSLEPYRQPWAPLTGRERREAPQSRAYPMQTRQQRGRDVDSRIPPPHWHPSMDVPHQHPEATAMRMEASLYGRRHVSQSYGHIHDGDREWYHGSLPAAYRPYADDRNPSFSYEYYRDMLPSGSWNRERLAFGHRDEQHGPHPPYRQYLPDRGNVFGIGAHSGHAQDHSQDLGMRPAISPQYSTHSGQAVAPGETQSATAPGILGRMYLSQIRMSSAMPGPPYTNQPGSSSRNRMHMQMSLWEQGQTHERHDSPSPVNSQ